LLEHQRAEIEREIDTLTQQVKVLEAAQQEVEAGRQPTWRSLRSAIGIKGAGLLDGNLLAGALANRRELGSSEMVPLRRPGRRASAKPATTRPGGCLAAAPQTQAPRWWLRSALSGQANGASGIAAGWRSRCGTIRSRRDPRRSHLS
jgi:hypothetical protein